MKITAKDFYNKWCEVVEENKEEIKNNWSNCPVYTDMILFRKNSIIEQVAKRLKLNYCNDYYQIDSVFYEEEDLIPEQEANKWLRNIRIAFEHENYFKSGLFKEVSNLLNLNCDIRVLVTYPKTINHEEEQLTYLHKIIKGNRDVESITKNKSFLLIYGKESGKIWTGNYYQNETWEQL